MSGDPVLATLLQLKVLHVLATDPDREWVGSHIVNHPLLSGYHTTAAYTAVKTLARGTAVEVTSPPVTSAPQRTYRLTATGLAAARRTPTDAPTDAPAGAPTGAGRSPR